MDIGGRSAGRRGCGHDCSRLCTEAVPVRLEPEPVLDSQIDLAFGLEPVLRIVPGGKTAALCAEVGGCGDPLLPLFGRHALSHAEAQWVEIGRHGCHDGTSAVARYQ